MEQEQAGRSRDEHDEPQIDDLKAKDVKSEGLDEDVDAILDEIDDVLEVNAEEFVKSFIQKGGQ
jgi:ubiquitin-like protein Pup